MDRMAKLVDIEAKEGVARLYDVVGTIPPQVTRRVAWSCDISAKIEAAMKCKRINVSQLAAAMHTDEEEIRYMLGGTYDFSLSTLANLSEILGIELM